MNDLETAELLAKIVKRWPNITTEQFTEWETGLPHAEHGTARRWLNQASQQADLAPFDDFAQWTQQQTIDPTRMTEAEQQAGLANVERLRAAWATRHQGTSA